MGQSISLRRIGITTLLATAAVLASAPSMTAAAARAHPAEGDTATRQRPNLVVFLADDLGRNTGALGDRDARTPNIDRLAASGMSFDRAFVASPA